MPYALHPLHSIEHDRDALWLSYEWGDSFENREWRPCVDHFLGEVSKLGHEVVPRPSPEFEPGEDFVSIAYLVGGIRTVFTSDLLLSLITVEPESRDLMQEIWERVGNQVGWAR